MRILVAGGAGYIGSTCVERLLDKGHEVTVFDSLVTGHVDAIDPRAKFVRGDLAERDKLIGLFSQGGFDGVLHFAAFALVGESMLDPGKYFRNNIANTINLADAAVAGKVGVFVFSSSCATFGQPDTETIDESTPQRPINPYGESKLCVERLLRWYSQLHGMKHVVLRYFNAAGASPSFGEDHSPETHLIPLVLQSPLGKRERIQILGDDYKTPDGTCVRDYIHVLDLAQAHEKALHVAASGCYNLGTGSGLSVKQIIDAARAVTGHAIPVEVAPRRPGDPDRLVACASLAKRELGWIPQFEDPKIIIESAWNWMKTHPSGYGK